MGNLLYNLFIILYKLALGLASLWNPKARLWVQGRKNILKKIRQEFQKTPAVVAGIRKHDGTVMPGNKKDNPPGQIQTIWMHCASLGEFEQGRPLLEKIRIAYPRAIIVLTFFSPSGYEVRKNYSGADHIFYLPLDTPSNAEQFIEIIQPGLVLWVKYEYWFHYLLGLKQKKIPVLLISGIFRKSQLFFKSYGGYMREILACFTHFFVQNEESGILLNSIGISNKVTLSGDTRFDRVIEIAEKFEPISLVDKFCGSNRVLVAGSTWTEDEEELTHYVKSHPEIRFIIAPHEVDRDTILNLKKEFPSAMVYSEFENEGGSLKEGKNLLIIDNIGMLARLYRYADIAYVGGGFGDDGIHNVLEAAVFGKPVIFGPVYHKYFEAIELLDSGGAISIENALQLEAVLEKLWSHQDELIKCGNAARNYVYSRAGATEIILEYIQRNRLLTI